MDHRFPWIRDITQKLHGRWLKFAAGSGRTGGSLLDHGDSVLVEMPDDAEWIPQSLEFDCEVPHISRVEEVRLRLVGWHIGRGMDRTAEFKRV